MYPFTSPSVSLTEGYGEKRAFSVAITGTGQGKHLILKNSNGRSVASNAGKRGGGSPAPQDPFSQLSVGADIPERHTSLSQVFLLTQILVDEVCVPK